MKGIILKKGIKANFIGNSEDFGAFVFAEDTQEIGTLISDGTYAWE